MEYYLSNNDLLTALFLNRDVLCGDSSTVQNKQKENLEKKKDKRSNVLRNGQ